MASCSNLLDFGLSEVYLRIDAGSFLNERDWARVQFSFATLAQFYNIMCS